MDRRIADFLEESIQRRSFPEDLPPRARGLSEDHVGDAFALGERDQAVRRFVGPDADDRGTEAFGESDVALQRVTIVACDLGGRLRGRLDVNRIPARAQPAGDSRAGPEHAWRGDARAHTDHHPLGDQRRLEPLTLAA